MPLPTRPVLALLVLALTGCEPTLATHLQSCGLLTEGEVGPRALAAFYAPDGCYQDCLARASCDELAEVLCGGGLELRRRCDERCAYRCPDDTLIAVEARCDGVPQCEGGADEEGCPTFTCRSGQTLPAIVRCSGWAECADGSDEEGCGRPTMCDGRVLSPWEICNGWESCADGSDERDCPQHVCADGQRITSRTDPRCDGWTLCSDGSDEAGCAAVQAMCR